MSSPRPRRGRNYAGERMDGLDPESRRRLEKRVQYLKRLGHGSLDKETRKAYLDTRKEINDLCQEINRNIRLYDGGSLPFTEKELDGLEQSDVEKYEKDESGKCLVPLNRAEFTKVMAHVSNYNTRKTFHDAWTSRLPENVPLFRKVILLRDENARRIGFRGDADLCLAGRMAKSTEWAEQLLADLASHLREPGRDLFRELETIKARLTEKGDKSVDVKANTAVLRCEVAYLKEIQARENKVDHKAISAYLPYKETTAAILRNVARYLQLRLEPIEKKDLVGCVWSDDVDVWAVWDEGEENGQFVGFFYGDLLDRPNKYKHNQTVELQASFLKEDGSRPYPAAILMCSFSPDIVDGCQVLPHSNIITMYHELGHALHALLARTKWGDSHGYRVCLEFGEAIGTCMENYAWLEDELKGISCHYAYTGDAYMQAWMERHPGQALPPRELPANLIGEMIRRRPKHRISYYLKQIADASFDMAVHNPKTHQDLESLNETTLFQDLEAQSTFTPAERSSYPQAAFSHLVSGYNSGYYAYVCSNVFGEEIFQSNFAADPTSTAAWDRFRRQLLGYGGSRDQTEVLEEFLGRPPTTASLLKSLEIS
ncbi:uncharacterized protein LMH87_008276 [Akanthomyces muscarius]|uniref:Peptidase M3A/M3B catalytic domain-containing protein n=1 Tax=Akanthomyces muscarius TaxID=2231603 RepID=A0A9W8UQQ8_AKAMU|nr:uncharacterized protein LMH87_008276 [Akanthomyces muscarius]KAJ4159374.1 hypothetical protein LMH87_008276 [Akanthomyces muscarius]